MSEYDPTKVIHGYDKPAEELHSAATLPERASDGTLLPANDSLVVADAQAQLNAARNALETAKRAQGDNFHSRLADNGNVSRELLKAEAQLAELEGKLAGATPGNMPVTQQADIAATAAAATSAANTAAMQPPPPPTETQAQKEEKAAAGQAAAMALVTGAFGLNAVNPELPTKEVASQGVVGGLLSALAAPVEKMVEANAITMATAERQRESLHSPEQDIIPMTFPPLPASLARKPDAVSDAREVRTEMAASSGYFGDGIGGTEHSPAMLFGNTPPLPTPSMGKSQEIGRSA